MTWRVGRFGGPRRRLLGPVPTSREETQIRAVGQIELDIRPVLGGGVDELHHSTILDNSVVHQGASRDGSTTDTLASHDRFHDDAVVVRCLRHVADRPGVGVALALLADRSRRVVQIHRTHDGLAQKRPSLLGIGLSLDPLQEYAVDLTSHSDSQVIAVLFGDRLEHQRLGHHVVHVRRLGGCGRG